MTCSPCQTTEIPDQQPDPAKFNHTQLVTFLESRLTEEQRVCDNAAFNIPALQKTIDALKAIV
jgi:hypothetical protein